jgi:hypothetical protein
MAFGGEALFICFAPRSLSGFGLFKTGDSDSISSAAFGLGAVTSGAAAVYSALGGGIAGGAAALRSDPQPTKKEIPANPRTAAAIHERFNRIESLHLLIRYLNLSHKHSLFPFLFLAQIVGQACFFTRHPY